MKDLFSSWKQDLPASIVVFLVALPLCLGVGLASTSTKGIEGLPNIFTGIIAGIIGGIIVGIISKSKIGVSGPAAGLITIVLSAITTIGSYEGFLVAVILAGLLQVIAGFIGLGALGNYFPSSVIKGMLAAIGITLILKEIPHALGYDKDFFGDESFFQYDGHNTFSELIYALNAFSPTAIIISAFSLILLIFFDSKRIKKIAIFRFIPGALIVVTIGIVLNQLLNGLGGYWSLNDKHLVNMPVSKSLGDFFKQFNQPDFSFLSNIKVYSIALSIALVASLETLLSVEATDKLDPNKNQTPTNHELKAQGIGNIVSGLLGGLPITQVIVRSSANVTAGGQTKMATMFHGILLLASVYFIPQIINLIPLASLAAILIMVGYKLSKIELYRSTYQLGMEQFLPFIGTIAGVIFTDLLKGIGIGLLIAIFFILRRNYKRNFNLITSPDEKEKRIILSENVSYLNKGSIIRLLDGIPASTSLIIDGTNCKYIDYDVREAISEFSSYTAKNRNIQISYVHFEN